MRLGGGEVLDFSNVFKYFTCVECKMKVLLRAFVDFPGKLEICIGFQTSKMVLLSTFADFQ